MPAGGQPLASSDRERFEPSFGRSFRDVRVHTTPAAAASARDIGALAYTTGSDIVFGAGGYRPGTPEGDHVLAHELTHVVQQSRGPAGVAATGVSEPHDAAEVEADAVADAVVQGKGAPRIRASAAGLSTYRGKGKDAIHFGKGDTATLKEESFTNPKKQPWIESIDISFTAVATDTGHKADALAAGEPEPRMPTGTLVAKYHDAKLPDVSVAIAGGSTMAAIGLTDRVKGEAVKRLEGLGYTDSQNIQLGNLTDPVAKTGQGARYSKSGAGTMNYAIFFKGIQAIHEGQLDTGSHACVHMGASDVIQRLNYHSVTGRTEVTVKYDASTLPNLCCHRRASGNPHWDRNPCDGIKASSCPKP